MAVGRVLLLKCFPCVVKEVPAKAAGKAAPAPAKAAGKLAPKAAATPDEGDDEEEEDVR